MFTVVAPPYIMALAQETAERRTEGSKRAGFHNPPFEANSEYWGALAEHALAYHLGIPPQEVGYDGKDGGVDFTVGGVTIDVKSSAKHDSSWVLPYKDRKKNEKAVADWYVLAFVIEPDTVIFKGKVRGDYVRKLDESVMVYNKRIVTLREAEDIAEEDFRP
jgi:hypothetical protein